jgi:hypothetical protein
MDARLLAGLSVYQDIVLGDETVRRGERDCAGRWRLIAPHLAEAGTVLDVGSNFGWFALQACRANPRTVVASVEADPRSAAVQRAVLAACEHRRICLLTRPAGAALLRRFTAAGQRFDAALVLNVLHWMRDHREFLAALGSIARRIVVEHPDADEAGAGIAEVRRQIGAIGAYLRDVFAGRTVERLGTVDSHRDASRPRELWLVGSAAPPTAGVGTGIAALPLLAEGASWPPRSWWQAEAAGLPSGGHVRFTAAGLQALSTATSVDERPALRRRVRRVPERQVLSRGESARRLARSAARRVLRTCGW